MDLVLTVSDFESVMWTQKCYSNLITAVFLDKILGNMFFKKTFSSSMKTKHEQGMQLNSQIKLIFQHQAEREKAKPNQSVLLSEWTRCVSKGKRLVMYRFNKRSWARLNNAIFSSMMGEQEYALLPPPPISRSEKVNKCTSCFNRNCVGKIQCISPEQCKQYPR